MEAPTSEGGPAGRRSAPHVEAPHRQLPGQQPLQLVSCHVLLRSALDGCGQILSIPGEGR